MAVQKYFSFFLVILGTVPGCVLGLFEPQYNPFIIAFFLGLAILSVSFILIWLCDAAQLDIPQALAIAVVSFVVILPESAVDIYFTWAAGHNPTGIYRYYVMANMTGSNKLLVGLGWAVVIICYSLIHGKSLSLNKDNQTELAFLLLTTVYAYILFYKGTLNIYDTVFLIGIYAWYIHVVSKKCCEEVELVGFIEILSKLSKRRRWLVIFLLFLYSGFVIILTAGGFSESLLAIGRRIHLNEFLLIQCFAPIASESPELILAIVFVLRKKGDLALGSLLSAQISQWTLLVGIIPVVYAISLGHIDPPMYMSKQQSYEILVTASQSLLGLGLLLTLQVGLCDALILLVLFFSQIILFLCSNSIEFYLGLEHSPERFNIYISLVYIIYAIYLFIKRHTSLWDLRNGFSLQKN